MDWSLYDNGLRLERVKNSFTSELMQVNSLTTLIQQTLKKANKQGQKHKRNKKIINANQLKVSYTIRVPTNRSTQIGFNFKYNII